MIGRAKQNIERCLSRDYDVTIYFVFQEPIIAWNYTKLRGIVGGRFVLKSDLLMIILIIVIIFTKLLNSTVILFQGM